MFLMANQDLPSCDLVMVIGTSLVVYPVAALPQSANSKVGAISISTYVVVYDASNTTKFLHYYRQCGVCSFGRVLLVAFRLEFGIIILDHSP